ncbi:hypothetical protein ACFQ14_03250 [Pseudahrensia aquimaris]|uniref:GIY-YIG domain-containing protein n=1 Tax=Pseudahrensia aquimaris TaxID=744461 RepID=A0ABW3FF10_9HYPH
MKRNPNTEAKSLPKGWKTDNAITTVEQVDGVEQVTRFRKPFSHVQLLRVLFGDVYSTLRQLQLTVPAVYAIVMSSEEDNVHSSVYVGSSGDVENRLRRHQYDTRFSSKAHTVFVLTTTSLEANSAHMRFAEGVINRMTADQPNVKVISQDVPAFEMGAHDEHIVKVIIKDAISLLAAAGYPMNAHASLVLKSVPFLDESEILDGEDEKNFSLTPIEIEDVLWEFNASAGVLRGYEMSGAVMSNGRFLVFPGSQYRVCDEHQLPRGLQSIRNRLEWSGYLEQTRAEDGRLELVFPVEFASPKQAVHALLKSNKPVEGYWSQKPMGGSAPTLEVQE